MKLVFMRLEAAMPGNYSYCCMRLPGDHPHEAALYQQMGHKVIEIPEETALELLEAQGKAFQHEFRVGHIFENGGLTGGAAKGKVDEQPS